MYASVFSRFNSHHFSLSFNHLALVVTLLLANAFAVSAYDGEVDLSYTASILGAGVGSTVAQQPDGKILVGGGFDLISGVARKTIGRINADGTIDQTFSAPSLTGSVSQINLLPDGKILVSGTYLFAVVNGQSKQGIFRLNADGTLDETFVAGVVIGSGGVNSVSLQADGKILITGAFAPGIARLNSDGSRDTGFNAVAGQSLPQPYTNLSYISALPDGEIMLYGQFSSVNGFTKPALARLKTDGSLDDTFTAAFPLGAFVGSVALQADGKILAAGNFTSVNGATARRLARLNPNGSLDTSFPVSADPIVDRVKVRADGKIFVSGGFTTINGANRKYIAILNADGSLDNSFNPNPDGRVEDVIASDNPVIVGQMSNFNNIEHLGIARVDAAGNVDPNFVAYLGNHQTVDKLFVLPDGKVLLGGRFSHIGNTPTNNLVRLNADGTLDSSFNAAVTLGSTFYSDYEISANSKIGVCCDSEIISTGDSRPVVLLNYDGSLDTSFNYTLGGQVHDMAFLPNGKVLITAYFGSGSSTVVILNADGTRDTSFMPVFNAADMYGVFVQNDGKFYALGSFTTVNGIPRKNIVRFNADGSIDQTFNPDLSRYNSQATTGKMYAQPDGKLLISGTFRGLDSKYLIRLNADGSLDRSFASPEVWFFDDQFVVQPDGRILIVLNNGPKVVRLKQNGRFDYSFNLLGLGANTSFVNSIGIQADNRILVAGSFASYNNVPRLSIARLENSLLTPPTIYDFDADGKSDLSLFRPSDTNWHVLTSSNSNYSATTFGLSDDKLVPGDYDRDGITDFAIFRPSDGFWYILNSSTNQVSTKKFGQSGDIPVPSDYNGDGVIDFAVYRPSTGVWWLTSSDWRPWDNGAVRAVPFGAAGDIPTIGDFDGDGKSDVAVWRPSNGVWYCFNSFTKQVSAYQFGVEGDKPTPADYDGDFKTDISVYRPSNGTWYRLNSSDNSLTGGRYGLEEDRPAPADYDGDGKADIAVFRPSTGVWYELRSAQGSHAEPFGLSGDMPVQNAFVP